MRSLRSGATRPEGKGAAVPPVRRVLGVAGSLRRDSFNRRLLEHAATVAPERLELHVEPDIIRLPLFDEDLEADGLPEDVQRVQALIREADGVLLASPEYNFGVPGPVKNFVDWASRPPGRGRVRRQAGGPDRRRRRARSAGRCSRRASCACRWPSSAPTCCRGHRCSSPRRTPASTRRRSSTSRRRRSCASPSIASSSCSTRWRRGRTR